MFDIDQVLYYRRALRRSRIRKEILLVLLQVGRLSFEELVRMTGAHPQNVLGAIQGDADRYRSDASLRTLGLVHERDVGGSRVFELTAYGAAVARRLRDEIERWLTERPEIRV